MKKIRVISIFLLILIGLNALIGGYLFIKDPSGALLHVSIEQLELSAFDDFLILGILLFLLNGVLSIITAFFVMFRWKGFAEMVILQGIILFIWMVVQIYFFDQIYLIQYIVLGIALSIFVCGLSLRHLHARNSGIL